MYLVLFIFIKSSDNKNILTTKKVELWYVVYILYILSFQQLIHFSCSYPLQHILQVVPAASITQVSKGYVRIQLLETRLYNYVVLEIATIQLIIILYFPCINFSDNSLHLRVRTVAMCVLLNAKKRVPLA